MSGMSSVTLVAEDGADLARLDLAVGHLVADEEEVAAAAALLVAVDAGVAGHGVQGEFVGLGHLAAPAALQEDVAEVVVHAVVGFELAELERDAVAGGVADRAEEDLRVGDVSLAQQEAEQFGQLGLQDARYGPHRTGHVEEDGDGERGGVLVGVAALPDGESLGGE